MIIDEVEPETNVKASPSDTNLAFVPFVNWFSSNVTVFPFANLPVRVRVAPSSSLPSPVLPAAITLLISTLVFFTVVSVPSTRVKVT